MKRQFRQLDQETKEKISRSSKGKTKSDMHKQHISQSMRKYWSQIPVNELYPLCGHVRCADCGADCGTKLSGYEAKQRHIHYYK